MNIGLNFSLFEFQVGDDDFLDFVIDAIVFDQEFVLFFVGSDEASFLPGVI